MNRFSRRSLLRGLGAGAGLLAPVVRQRAASAQAAPPGNLLIFYTPNGHKRRRTVNGQETLCFDAAPAAGGLTLGQSLMPLEPFQRDVAVIRGLSLKTPTFIASHQDICRILTCWGAPTEASDQSQFTAFGPSIDQVVARNLGQKPLVVAVDPFRDAPHWRTALSWSDSGVVAPFVKNHQAVFDELLGAPAPDDPLAAARARARRANLLDAYQDAVRSLEKRVARSATNTTLRARIAALPATAPRQIDDKSASGVVAEMQARGELWMDLLAMAFARGSRRVGVIQWQGVSEGYDPAADIGSPTHHSITMNGAGDQSLDRWIAIDTWYAQRFAYQLAALKQLGILDRTIVVWVSEISEAHNQLDMVTIVAGGQRLGMKTGKYIRYPFTGTEVEGAAAVGVAQNPANRSLADLWLTIQQAMGIDKATFGDPRWSGGALTELRG